jgi:hypothetical protein
MKIKIIKETSTFLLQPHHWNARRLEYITAQTRVLQVMAQTIVKIHQSITKQASLPKDHNTVTNDNHQNMTPPFDKEKLSAMQTQILQGSKQPSTTYFRNEMAKDRVHIGPVKRQVAKAWNNRRKKKKKHEALKLTMEKQHDVNKAPDMCPCGEHHGFSCPQKEASLMTAAARQHNLIDINKQRMLSTQKKPNSRRRFSS